MRHEQRTIRNYESKTDQRCREPSRSVSAVRPKEVGPAAIRADEASAGAARELGESAREDMRCVRAREVCVRCVCVRVNRAKYRANE